MTGKNYFITFNIFKRFPDFIIFFRLFFRYLLIVKNVETSKCMTFWSIFGLLLFGFIINFPHFFNYEAVPVYDSESGNVSYWTYNATEYGMSEMCQHYEFWLHCMLIVILPWIFIAILNMLIVRNIFFTSNNLMMAGGFSQVSLNNNMEPQHRRISVISITEDGCVGGGGSGIIGLSTERLKRLEQDRQITFQLLTVTFVFLILMAWQCVNQCFWMKKFGQGDDSGSIWDNTDTSYALAKIGVVINSSINTFLYCLTGTLFRTQLIKFFRCSNYEDTK